MNFVKNLEIVNGCPVIVTVIPKGMKTKTPTKKQLRSAKIAKKMEKGRKKRAINREINKEKHAIKYKKWRINKEIQEYEAFMRDK